MDLRERGDCVGERRERVEVALRLPARRDRRLHRVDERVEVGRGEIVLLVGGRRRQDDVGEQPGRGHAEVERDHEVELALRRGAHHRVAHAIRRLVGDRERLHAEVVAQEVLVTLRARGERVAAPGEEHPRPRLRRVRVLHREPHLPLLQRAHHVRGDRLRVRRASRGGLARDVERALVELRVEGEPALPHRTDLVVHRVRAVAARRGVEAPLALGPLIAPLVGVDVVERRRVLEPRGLRPVERARDGGPRRDRRELLLADVVVEARRRSCRRSRRA